MPKKKAKLAKKIDPLTIIDLHKIYRSLDIVGENLTELPENIGDYRDLQMVRLTSNSLSALPDSIGKLHNLIELYANYNYLTNLPNTITQLVQLKSLYLNNNFLIGLPEDIGNLEKLEELNLSDNQLSILPDSIGNLEKLVELDLSNNRLTSLPASIDRLINLQKIFLWGNPLSDLTFLTNLPNLYIVEFRGVFLPRKFWCKLSDWQLEWLEQEKDPQVRQMLIDYFGYQKICEQLNVRSIDRWREYNLMKIDRVEQLYDGGGYPIPTSKPIALLQMVCPSTKHTHILRVPPEIESAEAAITWANHGVHPDRFILQS